MKFADGGKPLGPLQVVGSTDRHGSTVRFKADAEIFRETQVINLKH